MGDWTYLVQSLPEGEDWGEFSGPGLSIKLPLHVSNPGDYLQLGDDSRAYCTLARALDVSRETKQGGLVCLWKGTDDRFVVLYVMFCACTCKLCACVVYTIVHSSPQNMHEHIHVYTHNIHVYAHSTHTHMYTNTIMHSFPSHLQPGGNGNIPKWQPLPLFPSSSWGASLTGDCPIIKTLSQIGL